MLGYDRYPLACEGRIGAVAASATAMQVLARWQALAAAPAERIQEPPAGQEILSASTSARCA